MKRIIVDVVTASDGTATVYSPFTKGKVHSAHYLKDGTNAFADGVDFTITADKTGETIWAQSNVNASAVVHPRAATHSTAGVAALYASGGTAVQDEVGIANDRIKVVIAQGGDTKNGQFMFLIAD